MTSAASRPRPQYNLSDFNYPLPPELIAAYPPSDRPSARLLYAACGSDAMSHHTFRDIKQFLKKGDVLVLNNTKVRPARIYGQKESGGNVEALLLKEGVSGEWTCLLRPGGRIKKGMTLIFGEKDCLLEAEVLDDAADSAQRNIKFWDRDFKEKLGKIGHIPLPPYINRPDSALDREMYQTVFAEKEGAVASPTAGLHFDQALLNDLKARGVEIVYVTLHIGYGTFQSVSEQDLSKHQMFAEEYELSPEAADTVNRALDEKRRVIACGTTSVRTLESAVNASGRVAAQKGETRLFIYPPYEFKVVKGLITNFHLPESTLLFLVAAFLGKEKMDAVYTAAIKEKYRFYSYGDAMLVLS